MFKVGDKVSFNKDNIRCINDFSTNIDNIFIVDKVDGGTDPLLRVRPFDSYCKGISYFAYRFEPYHEKEETELKATVQIKEKEVVTKVTEKIVNLPLTEREASLLLQIFDKIGGIPKNSARGEIREIHQRLIATEILKANEPFQERAEYLYYANYKD